VSPANWVQFLLSPLVIASLPLTNSPPVTLALNRQTAQ